MKDICGHEIPVIEDEIMAHFDSQIRGDFGNTAKILREAHEDLSAENAAAAAEDYGRGVSLHESCDYREAKLKAQIERLIVRGHPLSNHDSPLHKALTRSLWDNEVLYARELIK